MLGDTAESLPRRGGIFEVSRLQLYGYVLAFLYAQFFIKVYWNGFWIADLSGVPLYTDFSTTWVVGVQALHRDVARLYDQEQFTQIQASMLGVAKVFYQNWPYPPILFLFMAPFGLLPYSHAFLTWDIVTLASLVVVVYLIVRRGPAIALVLASPFTAWNFLAGQNGFLTGSLLGAALLLLERQPVLAGMFIGCLSYKPQFGLLIPVALAAAGQWRAFASAAATVAALVSASIAAFGTAAWEAFPRGMSAQFGVVLQGGGQPDPAAHWGRIQTVYGLIRDLHGGADLAWLAQGATATCLAILVWRVWRSGTRYALKAATLSAVALVATPYAFTYDMAALAIPVAFLASDQLRHGVLRGERPVLFGLFVASLAALIGFGDTPGRLTFGEVPIGPVIVAALLVLVLRRSAVQPAGPLNE